MAQSYVLKRTLNIDDHLFQQAKRACGAATDTETVRLGLESLVRPVMLVSAFEFFVVASLTRKMFPDVVKSRRPNAEWPDGSGRHLGLDSFPC